MSQLSFFSAEATAPSYADLEGLLAGPGQVVLRASEARIGIVVTDVWRVAALTAELERLGLAAETAPGEQHGAVAVRTPFRRELRPTALAWAAGAVKRPPPGFALDGRRLRWWCLGAGAGEDGTYTLALGPHDDSAWSAVGAALAAAGVPGAFVGPRAAGPAYRIVGLRRLARLRELVGDPPEQAPLHAWPGVRS